ncbi:lymphotoxin-alpha-like isoform X1 [Pungitius pungitius]|uniref:lymphotoxin-alpha-like isoform X1 n=1 Tax=Pungitius pungitius TaxID=134920 RepID=UPI002E1315E3
MEDGGELGLHRDALVQLLLRNETRHRRMARLLGLALLLLTGALALLTAVVFGGRARQSPESQPMIHPQTYSPGLSVQQKQDFSNPSAMLTAPLGNSVTRSYLEWEIEIGNAFCRGGFNYSKGRLVVPRRGIYRVFLQVTYEEKADFICNDTLRLTNTVFYFRDTYKKNVPLLTSVDTVNCSQKLWIKTLYTAGLFSLDAGGQLHVNSSHPELIDNRETNVFFGAELLPQ